MFVCHNHLAYDRVILAQWPGVDVNWRGWIDHQPDPDSNQTYMGAGPSPGPFLGLQGPNLSLSPRQAWKHFTSRLA